MFKEQQHTRHLEAAAGRTRRSADAHDEQQHVAREFRPLVKVRRAVAGRRHDRGDREEAVTEGLPEIARIKPAEHIDCNEQRGTEHDNPVPAELLVVEHILPLPGQHQIVDREVDTEERHEDTDCHLHKLARIGRDRIVLNRKATRARCAESVHDGIKKRHALEKQNNHHQDGHRKVDDVGNLCGRRNLGHQLADRGARTLSLHEL